MEEQVKAFKKRLRDMGFNRKTDRVFWYDNNGLFYVVSFKMSGKTTQKIGLEVSHAGMFDDGAPRPRSCPIGGWLGPWCLCNGFSVHGEKDGSLHWLEAVLNVDFLERVAKDFFSYFKSAADWRIASQKWQDEGGWWTDDWPARINDVHFLEKPISDNVGGSAVSWFVNQTPGEMQSADVFTGHIHRLLVVNAQRLGFYLRDKLLLVRRRGTLYDCFSLELDDFGCFLSVNPFIWTDRFNEHILLNEECPYVNYNAELLFDAVWIRTPNLIDNAQYLEELIYKANAFFLQFSTAEDWLDYLEKHEKREKRETIKRWFISELKSSLS